MEPQDRNASFFRFEDLRVYAKAIDYATWLVSSLREPGSEAERTLMVQFNRSAYNIAIIIAEGSSRNKMHFQQYLKNAKSAIRECVVFTEVSFKMDMMSQEHYNRSRDSLMELTRMVGALIISLQRGAARRDDESDDMIGENDEETYGNINLGF